MHLKSGQEGREISSAETNSEVSTRRASHTKAIPRRKRSRRRQADCSEPKDPPAGPQRARAKQLRRGSAACGSFGRARGRGRPADSPRWHCRPGGRRRDGLLSTGCRPRSHGHLRPLRGPRLIVIVVSLYRCRCAAGTTARSCGLRPGRRQPDRAGRPGRPVRNPGSRK